MAITKAVCCKCGKALERIPAYLAEGDGAKLFECEACFYPGCVVTRRNRDGGIRRQLEALLDDAELEPAGSR